MSRPYILIPMGPHLLNLEKFNPLRVVAVIDYRANGSLHNQGVEKLCDQVHMLGQESTTPLLSWMRNRRYYRQLADLLQELQNKYEQAKFVITANYTPFNRFVIDTVGAENIELWEDGLNHYIRLQSFLPAFKIKELVKLTSGYYMGGAFQDNYRGDEILVRDRFQHNNLDYPRTQLTGEKAFYIGQPLIEDHLISERQYRQKLAKFFAGQVVHYLPHPREKKRAWLSQIFKLEQPNCSAETYLADQGAKAVYSAFSTVNANIQCDNNCFLAAYLGLDLIAGRLSEFDFGVQQI